MSDKDSRIDVEPFLEFAEEQLISDQWKHNKDNIVVVVSERPNRPSRTPAPDRGELSKVDYILSQRNSNPGQGYYFPPGMTTAEDRQHAQRMADNIGNSEPFLSEFNAYKSKHGYR